MPFVVRNLRDNGLDFNVLDIGSTEPAWKFSDKNISIVRALIGMSEFATFMSFRPTTHHANSIERTKDFLSALPDRDL